VKLFIQVTTWRHRERSYEFLELYRAILKQQILTYSYFVTDRDLLSYRPNIQRLLCARVSLKANSYRLPVEQLRWLIHCANSFPSLEYSYFLSGRKSNSLVKEIQKENFCLRYFSIFSINILDMWRIPIFTRLSTLREKFWYMWL